MRKLLTDDLIDAVSKTSYEFNRFRGPQKWPTWDEYPKRQKEILREGVKACIISFLSEAEAAGYVVVPKEPTEEMLLAAALAFYRHGGLKWDERTQEMRDLMIARMTVAIPAALAALPEVTEK